MRAYDRAIEMFWYLQWKRGSFDRDDEEMEEQVSERHQTGRTVNEAVRAQTKAESIGQETEMRTGEERDHVGQRQISSSKTGFWQGGNSKAETKIVHRDVDRLEEDTAPSPWAEKPMTAEKIRIREVLRREERDPFPLRRWDEVDEDESEEEAACGRSIDLGDINGKVWGKKITDDGKSKEGECWEGSREKTVEYIGRKQGRSTLEGWRGGDQKWTLKGSRFWLQAKFRLSRRRWENAGQEKWSNRLTLETACDFRIPRIILYRLLVESVGGHSGPIHHPFKPVFSPIALK
jgi:hypothetical protein